MFAFMPFLLAFYAWTSLFLFSPVPRWAKCAGIILLLACALKFEIYQFMGTGWISPKLPQGVSWFLESSFNFLIILCILCFLRDVVFLVLALAWKADLKDFASPLRGDAAIAVMLSASVILGVFGYHEAIKVPDVKKIALSLPGLPKMKAVHLSDLHVEANLDPAWLPGVIEKVNGLEPDVVFITGDFADGFPEDVGEMARPLADIKAPVLGVTGNHECYWHLDAWRKKLESLGVKIMDGRKEILEINNVPVVIQGICDMKLASAVPEATDFLLAHRPFRNAEFGKMAKLTLSGHTHGGQLFFLRPLTEKLNGGYSSGLKRNSLTSPGTGLWRGMPIRLGVPSEITLIEIN